ncbi:aldehyde dehydrogenase [Thermoleophilia bacterium SCSIO 60948]|nr:aldehyde dehydrogenase [Thermoleophilia bacterium SCSIO 60948]
MGVAATVLLHVDGRWREAASGDSQADLSPVDGEVIAEVAQAGTEDVDAAVAAAGRAGESWRRLTAFERAEHMHAVADLIEGRRDELARICTTDQGKPLAESNDEVTELVEYWRLAAEDAKRLGGELANSTTAGARALLVRRARGVVGVISPWNWPYTMPAELIAPALACGNTVVWAPAPSTSLSAQALTSCVADAGLPGGVLNLLPGPGPVVGDAIARHPDVQGVGFIGSTATGMKVATAAAGKAQIIEMGGNGPLVVMDDADLEAAVTASLEACFLCAGQSCTAGERVLVHRAVHDRFVDRLVARAEQEIRLGDPFAEDTTLGPMNNEATAAKMDAHVADAIERGATVRLGGERAADRATALYWPATILTDVDPEALVVREETFGPVAPIVAIDSLDEAIELTNASPYGLLSAVFTADLAAGLRFADAVKSGWVNINQGTNYWESQLPFGGGARSDSGLGRVGGAQVMHAFTELQTVIVHP